MPLYFLHVRGGQAPVEAAEGWELADDATAHANAISAARSLIASDVLDGILDLSARIDVEDENGTPLFTVPFAAAVARP